VEDLGAGCGGELVAESDGRLVLDPERNVGLATTGVGRQREEQLGWLARQGVPERPGLQFVAGLAARWGWRQSA
jgi:hypothetical protein